MPKTIKKLKNNLQNIINLHVFSERLFVSTEEEEEGGGITEGLLGKHWSGGGRWRLQRGGGGGLWATVEEFSTSTNCPSRN